MIQDFFIKAFLLGLAIATPFLLAHEAHAGDFWLDANVASYHTGADGYCYQGKCDDFNQFNYGLGLSYDMDDTIEWQVGFYRNSYDQNSTYADIKFKHDFNVGSVTVSPGLAIGFVTGYDNTQVEARPLQPMALPTVAVTYDRVRVVVGYLPLKLVTSDSETDVVTFQVGYRF